MFHIFRWRRDRRNGSVGLSNLLTDGEHKRLHSQRRRLRVYQGRQTLERFFHLGRHQSPTNDHDKRQVK